MKPSFRMPQGVSILLAFALGAAVFALVLWLAGVKPTVKRELSNIDVVTVVLGSLGVMVSILTLFLAVLAFYGWATFRTIIDERFDEAVRNRFDPSREEYKTLLEKVIEDSKSLQQTEALLEESVPPLPTSEQPIKDEIK